MKAKKRILAILFSVLMVWQGYSLARAEGEIPLFISEEHAESTEMESSTHELSSTVEENEALYNTAPEESAVAVTDVANATNEFPSDFNTENALLEGNEQEEDTTYTYTAPQGFSKSVRGEVQEIKDGDGNFHYIMEYVVRFDAKSFEGTHNENGYDSVQFVDRLGASNFGYFMPYSFYSGYSIDGSLYQPVLRRGVWRSGEWKVAQNGKKYFEPAVDDANPGSIYSLRSDAEGLKPAENETIYPDFVHDGKDIPVGFTCNLDHIAPNEGFELRYFVELHEFPQNGSSFNNIAKLVGIDTEEINSFYKIQQNLNTFQGKKHSIRIKKTDKASGDALHGAEFMLTKKYSNYNKMVTTWYNGEIIIDNLTNGEYEIVEVDPPSGYKLDKTVHNVTITETDNKTEYPLELTNKKINPNTRDIIVEKKWAVTVKPGTPSPASLLDDYLSGRLPLFDDSLHDSLLSDTADFDSHDVLSDDRENNSLAATSALDVLMDHFTSDTSRVKVYLLVNEEKKEELSAILSDDNDWQHIFEEMPRKDENGKDIVYSVKEEPVKGYKAAISGTQDTKFTITNYYDEDDSFVIPVTKIWEGKGKRPKEIVVELWGDGSYLDSATLSAVNDWQHNFFVLKEKNGKKIEYTVKEVEVEGYTSTIENHLNSGRGFIITNTSNTPPEEENTPEPPKGNDNPPTPGTNENTPPKPNDNGGTPPTPSRGGNTPGNPGGGGSTPPRVVETPPAGGTTPPTVETPGEVLGADRTSSSGKTKLAPQVLGADRSEKVLNQGRGWTKTFDSNAIYLYLSFFLLSLTGLAFVVIQRKRNTENKM